MKADEIPQLRTKEGNPEKALSGVPINTKRGDLPCIHLEPAMIVSTVFRVVDSYGNENEGKHNSPTEDNVLPQKGEKHTKVLSDVPINTERGDLPCIHLEPAMIVSTVVRVVDGYGNKNVGRRDSPTEDNVLQFRKHAILVPKLYIPSTLNTDI